MDKKHSTAPRVPVAPKTRLAKLEVNRPPPSAPRLPGASGVGAPTRPGILTGSPGPRPRGETDMDEETRRERQLEALEHIAAELERLRMLRERELGARVVDVEGTLVVRPVGEG
jgi:hypothetical protein